MLTKSKICILTQSHLCRNPRVLKEAIALSTNDHPVYILNSITSQDLHQQDLDLIKSYAAIHIQHVSDLTKKNLNSFIDRAFYKLGGLLMRYLKIENSLALGYGALRYLKKSKTINADLYICHQELAAYTGTKLIKEGYKVAFDLEDWHSADLLAEARNKRPISLLQKVESIALKNGLFCTTTSNVLAQKLAQIYSCKQPAVIYNTFPVQIKLLKKEKKFSHPLKLFWFSQTVGPGRGIEEFISLLKSINNSLELHLLGNVDLKYRQYLTSAMPGQHSLFFHILVSATELPEKIANFDIGLAIELAEPPSRNYTITNKFFQYLQAGLPVIATETAGQKEAFEKFSPGIMIPHNLASDHIKKLENWLNDPSALRNAKSAANTSAMFYSWENESKKLLNLINEFGPKS